MQIILASQSPRRRQLIQLLGLEVVATSADVDELSITIPDPAQNAIDTALLKTRAIAAQMAKLAQPCVIIGSDTNVAYGNLILGKPRDAAEARHMLTMLRNRVHQVHTGIALLRLPEQTLLTSVSTSNVQMRDYSDAEIEAYIATGDPFDKAGAYAIQHPAFRPVAHIDGCFAGIMGLSLCDLAGALRTLGATVPAALETPCSTTHCFEQAAYDPSFSADASDI